MVRQLSPSTSLQFARYWSRGRLRIRPSSAAMDEGQGCRGWPMSESWLTRSSPTQPDSSDSRSGLVDRYPWPINKEAAEVRRVGSEHHRFMGISGMGGDDGVDTSRDPTSSGSFDPKSQLARSTGRCLISVYGSDPPDQLVDRSVLGATGDRLGKRHGRNDGLPSMLEEITQHPSKLLVACSPIDHPGVEHNCGIAHDDAADRILAARRPARCLIGSGVGSLASSSSRYSRNARRRSSRSSLSSRAAST